MAKKEKMIKTNAMRILDKNKISYQVYEYPHGDEAVPGEEVARLLDFEPGRIFKTLVTTAKEGYYVFVIPVDRELDLKKAAKAAGVKAIEMLKVALLFDLTGYVRGGCTAVGMKKQFPVYINDTALNYDRICVSGGKIGLQIELNPDDLAKTVKARFTDLLM